MTQTATGWQCPRCHRIHGPTTASCDPCNAEMGMGGKTAEAKLRFDGIETQRNLLRQVLRGVGGISNSNAQTATTGQLDTWTASFAPGVPPEDI